MIVSILFFFHIPLISKHLKIRIYDHKDRGSYTRIVFEREGGFTYTSGDDKKSSRFTITLLKSIPKHAIQIDNRSKFIRKLDIRTDEQQCKVGIISASPFYLWREFVLNDPFRAVLDLKPGTRARPTPQKNNSPKVNEPESEIKKHNKKDNPEKNINPGKTNDRKQSSNKSDDPEVNKIDVICIDAGHGGENLGAVGRSLTEKEITLKISRELRKLIRQQLKMKVVMVRDSDVDISLNRRAEIANNNNADIFISIHVNSSHKREAKGPETFFVSLNATDKESYELAMKENESYKEIEKKVETDELKMILWNMAQADYIRESSKLAEKIQAELNILMNTRNRGVKQAPFRVLMRASMPAVLVEVGFISNLKEAKMMKKNAFYRDAAMSIFKGLKKYINK